MLVAQHGQDHGGFWFFSSLLWPSEPLWSAVECGPGVEVLNLVVGLDDGILSVGDVVDDDLSHLYLFLEVGSKGQEGEDDLLQCISRLQKVVGGGVSTSNKLYVFVVEDSGLCHGCLGKGGVDGLSQGEGSNGVRDGFPIPGDEAGSIASWGGRQEWCWWVWKALVPSFWPPWPRSAGRSRGRGAWNH